MIQILYPETPIKNHQEEQTLKTMIQNCENLQAECLEIESKAAANSLTISKIQRELEVMLGNLRKEKNVYLTAGRQEPKLEYCKDHDIQYDPEIFACCPDCEEEPQGDGDED